jgi:hypothetical protein
MPAHPTQVISGARRTEYASRGGIDPADKLFGVVKAFNQRQGGREYGPGTTDALFDAVKAFNTRRLG